MTPNVGNVLDLLEDVAPSRLAESWDNPGLQVGRRDQPVRRVLFALDPTVTAIQRGIDSGAQLVITHHPLIFKPLFTVNVSSYPGNAIRTAVSSGIAVVCVHTNLDVAPGGINDILAGLLGLDDVEVLEEVPDGRGAGLGRVGTLREPSTLARLQKRVSEMVGSLKVRMVGDRAEWIQRAAVVGGSGGGLAAAAAEKGAHVLITGDVTHHQALDAESLGLAVIDAGHFNTEKTAFSLFARQLGDLMDSRGWDAVVEVAAEEKDPIRETGE